MISLCFSEGNIFVDIKKYISIYYEGSLLSSDKKGEINYQPMHKPNLFQMFSKYFSNSNTVSYVGTLLDKPGVTLQEILEQDEVDIVYECEHGNTELID